MTKNIYIVRHCKAEGQEPQAQLTTLGEMQARELVEFFKDYQVDRIVSSPYIRAVGTIEPYAKEHNMPIEIDRRIAERLMSKQLLSSWMDQLESQFPLANLNAIDRISSKDKRTRAVQAIQDIESRDEENTVIISHGGVIPLILDHYDSGSRFHRLTNPDVHLLTLDGKRTTVNRIWIP
ncbi:2,3-bisphosphoglycerate-dependent phosphoglycerate mutase [Alkalibacillus filiformis]|uniref:2,3-bisphosphoglycerate-dependent phosphoglycerate mutase n=1 Tax=Alkalibacillus filiformis TaxID=200990 RepID=A0ABU0DUJ0_9BACI|nr:histidine phosphatase family protein [Alkalibacillus filiformis]MDQ0351941.1 2,3-bisphosphoglycerate-dependent phosphoglycerate mutase [Alkalibacillus filiformis]